MIKVKIARLSGGERVQWDEYEFEHVPLQPLLTYIEAEPKLVAMIIGGCGIVRGADVASYIPVDGDEINVIPNINARALPYIGAVIGAVIGYYASGGNPMGAVKGAMYGYSLGSAAAGLITRRQKLAKPDDPGPTRYSFDGVTNDERVGINVPVVFGKHKIAGVRIGTFIRRRMGVLQGPNNTASPTMIDELHQLFLLGPGPINSVSDVKINNQPIANFPGASYDVRLGTATQTAFDDFNIVANTFSIQQDLTTTPFIWTTQVARNMTSFELLIDILGLAHTDGKGNVDKNISRFKVRYRLTGSGAGGWSAYDQVNVIGSQKTLMPFLYRKAGLTPGQYDIEVTFVSADHVDPNTDLWQMRLHSVTEELDTPLAYPGYALLCVKALPTEQLNGAVPTVTCVVEGLLLRRWNGSALTAAEWTAPDGKITGRNPAWAALEILLNTNTFVGRWVDSTKEIDYDSFKTGADYHDTLATVTPSVGASFTETRHMLDIVLDKQAPALQLLNDILAPSRSAIMFVGGKWRYFVDAPGNAVALFTMGNIAGNFKVQYRSATEMFNAFDVQFVNQDNDWEPDNRRAVSKQEVEIGGAFIKPESLSLIGATRFTQVFREARIRLNQSHYLTRTISFDAFTDALFIEPGDIINFQHDLPQWGFGGRVVSAANASTITLDQPVTLLAGHTYELRVRPVNGTNDAGEVKTVSNAPGTYTTLTVSTPFSFTPQNHDVYAFGETSISVKPYRVMEISRTSDQIRNISAIEYNASIYDDSGTVTIINYSTLPSFNSPPPPIASLNAALEIGERADHRRVTTIILTWPRPVTQSGYGVYRGAKVERSFDGVNWEPAPGGVVVGTEWRWVDPPDFLTMYFKVTPYSTLDIYNNAGSATTSLTSLGYGTAAPVVSGFSGTYIDDSISYQWTDLGPQYQYEIRSTDAGWNSPGALYRGRAQNFRLEQPARAQTVYIRAFDSFGNFSSSSTALSLSKPAPSAPTIDTSKIVRSDDSVKIPVATVSGASRFYLWASKGSGFVPSDTTRVAQVVPGAGGEFIFKTDDPAAFFFKIAAADAITERLKDFVYSSEFSTSIVRISPVNPSTVTFSKNPAITRRRAVRSGSSGTQRDTVQVFATYVNWSFADGVNPAGTLVGFQVIVYPSIGGDPNLPFWDSGLLANVSQRSVGIPDLLVENADNYIAAVRAIYISGFSSQLVTSTGLFLDPVTGEPAIQTSDDRNVSVYAETFDGAAVPLGFTQAPGDSIFAAGNSSSSSALFVNSSNAAQTYVDWSIKTWADKYLDKRRGGAFSVLLAVNVQSTVASNYTGVKPSIRFDDGAGGLTTKTFDFQQDVKQHIYKIDFTDRFLPSNAASAPVIRIDFSNVFTTPTQWSILGVAISFDDLAWNVDGWMDRAMGARDNFAKDPTFGGFFLQSPIRQPNDPDGNIVVVDSNGMFVVKSNGTEVAYKRGRRGKIGPSFNLDTIGWDTAQANTDPPIPQAAATNKLRILLERSGSESLQAAPTNFPVRTYVEACEFTTNGFRIHSVTFEGGSLARVAKSTLDPSSNASHRTLSLDLDTQQLVTNAADGWLDMSDQFTLALNRYFCFRTIAWLNIQMPLIKKSTGSYYSVDLYFWIHRGRIRTGSTNPMLLAGGFSYGPIKIRALTDGQLWTYPYVMGGSTLATNVVLAPSGSLFDYNPDAQNVKVDWYSIIGESGSGVGFGQTLPTVQLDRVEVAYILDRQLTWTPTWGEYFNYLFAEEF